MESKHDLFTMIITVILIVATVVLAITNHLTGAIGSGLIAGLGAVFVYWFTRGGVISGQQTTPTQPTSADTTATVVSAVLDSLAQTPAKGVDANAGGVQSGNKN